MELTFIYFKRLSLLTPVLLFLTVFLMGAGHGWYGPAILLFPFGFISILYSRTIELCFIILAIIQYPVYGLMIDLLGSDKSFKWATISIMVLHLILAILILIFRADNFK